MTKKDKIHYRKMWRAVVKHKHPYCGWCDYAGRQSHDVLQADHILGKPNYLLDFWLPNGDGLCLTCNVYRKGSGFEGELKGLYRLWKTGEYLPNYEFRLVGYFQYLILRIGEERFVSLIDMSEMTSKSNPALLRAELVILEEEYAKLKEVAK